MIGAEMPLEPVDANYQGEVAERWRYRDGSGEIGVIASVTQAFCRDCTRARLSTEGKLYTCLFATQGHDLRALLRGGASDDGNPRGGNGDLDEARRPVFGNPHLGDRAAEKNRDVVHRRLTPLPRKKAQGKRMNPGIVLEACAVAVVPSFAFRLASFCLEMSRPQITHATRPLTFDVEALNEKGEVLPTPIAGEHPLTLYVDKREIVTLMTLGQAPEALAIGYLRNQRLVGSIEEIAEVQVDWDTDAVAVTTRNRSVGENRKMREKMKKRTVTTGCGQGTVFGDLMEEIDSIRLRDDVRLTEETLYGLLDTVRRYETIYKSAGAVHGCALADGAEIISFRRGRGTPQRGGRHRRADVARRHRRLGQDLLYHRAAHLGDGHQGGADAHTLSGLALGPHADGIRNREQGRHHHDRARRGQALPAVHREASVRQDRHANDVGMTRRNGRRDERFIPHPSSLIPVTGVILAGGLGRRMGGVDKGLKVLRGRPMVAWVIERFAPQVDEILVNANQNLETYSAFGYRVIPDTITGFAGPLAGLHRGLSEARHELVATAPCDSPFLPADLIQRLRGALDATSSVIAVAKTGTNPTRYSACAARACCRD